MSRKVERAVGGLMTSLFGSLSGGSIGIFGSPSSTCMTQPSLPFLAFVEKAQLARKQSREVRLCVVEAGRG